MSKAETQKLLVAIHQQIAATRAEAQRQFEETRRQFEILNEPLKQETRLLAEGITNLGERVTRELGRLGENIDHGFASLQL